jgi:hypothetical protein
LEEGEEDDVDADFGGVVPSVAFALKRLLTL